MIEWRSVGSRVGRGFARGAALIAAGAVCIGSGALAQGDKARPAPTPELPAVSERDCPPVSAAAQASHELWYLIVDNAFMGPCKLTRSEAEGMRAAAERSKAGVRIRLYGTGKTDPCIFLFRDLRSGAISALTRTDMSVSRSQEAKTQGLGSNILRGTQCK